MTLLGASALSAEAFRARARARLAPEFIWEPCGPGDFALNPPGPDAQTLARAAPAAILAPIVERADGLQVLLTRRAAAMRSHSGQVAFPGGKIDLGETPLDAALREAFEEVGLAPAFIEPLGWLDPYLTGTGFRIAPLVALVRPGFALRLNAHEVEDSFEAPLSFLMDPANHRRESRIWQGKTRHFYAMTFEDRYIWGATAGILRNLYERLHS